VGFDQDELATMHFAQMPLRQILFGPGFDNHPPLYYALIHIWLSAAGVSEVALRLPSVLLGTLAVWLAFVVGRAALNDAAGWAGAIGLALPRPHILISQHGRMYELLVVFALLSIWSMVSLVKRPGAGRLLLYVVVTELMIYTQSAGVFVVAAQNIFCVVAVVFGYLPRQRRHVLSWIGAQGLIVLLYAPWMAIVAHRLAAVQQAFWVKQESVISYMGGLLFFFAGTPVDPVAFLIAPAMTILMALAFWRAVQLREAKAVPGRPGVVGGVGLAAAVAVLPGLALAILSQVSQPVFVPRALLPSAVACYWLVGFAISTLGSRWRVSFVSLGLLAVIASAARFELVRPSGTDLRDAIGDLCYEVHSGDMVYLHGWPEAKDYMAKICSAPGDAESTPRVITSWAGELEAAVKGWCQDPAHDALYVMHVSNSETPVYGLITVAEYLAILGDAHLVLSRRNDMTVGHINLWHCRRPMN
jgi:uncharacterized membrane protein